MQGLAKSQFQSTYKRTPWDERQESIKKPRWPFIERLLDQNYLSYLDYILAQRLLREFPDVTENVALFICHLSLAAKEGHLCIRKQGDDLFPAIEQLWINDEGHPLPHEEVFVLKEMILSGAKDIPESIIEKINRQQNIPPHTPLCSSENHFYFQRYWMFETVFLTHLMKHLQAVPQLKLDPEKVKKSIEEQLKEGFLLKEQAIAIEQGCLNGLTLITGGPGTGKTYTAGCLIKTFWENLSPEQKCSCQVVLAAPTGKAAANLQKSLGRVAAKLEGFPPIQAKTLHSLLGFKQGNSNQQPQRLSADFLIVDESSMIDIRIMAALFESLKPGSRLVLLGDRYQLPAVEAGNAFIDLIELQQKHPSLNITCATLSVCLRAELKSLVDFAQLVNKGLSGEVLDDLTDRKSKGIKRLIFSDDKKRAQRDFLTHALKYFPSLINPDQDPEQLLNLFNSIRILSPMRKGAFGVESLNQEIWKRLCQQMPMHGWVAIPIMIAVNDYRQELFNGETGVLIRSLPLNGINKEDYALFPSRQEGGLVRRISGLLLPKYEFAYCLSVHKSQGSEFDRALLVLPEGAELFGREVVYTAITRARKELEIFGSDAVIRKTIEQKGIRLSGIQDRIKNEFLSHSQK